MKYLVGKDAPIDYVKAAYWLELAAAQGLPKAQTNLGYLYLQGLGVERNPKRAVELYRAAAEMGEPAAQANLGNAYFYGANEALYYDSGIASDYMKAFEWYRRSAEQGNGVAQSLLARSYANGTGVRVDYIEAYKWTEIALANFEPTNKNLIETERRFQDYVASNLSASDIATAKTMAKNWQPKPETKAATTP